MLGGDVSLFSKLSTENDIDFADISQILTELYKIKENFNNKNKILENVINDIENIIYNVSFIKEDNVETLFLGESSATTIKDGIE